MCFKWCSVFNLLESVCYLLVHKLYTLATCIYLYNFCNSVKAFQCRVYLPFQCNCAAHTQLVAVWTFSFLYSILVVLFGFNLYIQTNTICFVCNVQVFYFILFGQFSVIMSLHVKRVCLFE